MPAPNSKAYMGDRNTGNGTQVPVQDVVRAQVQDVEQVPVQGVPDAQVQGAQVPDAMPVGNNVELDDSTVELKQYSAGQKPATLIL